MCEHGRTTPKKKTDDRLEISLLLHLPRPPDLAVPYLPRLIEAAQCDLHTWPKAGARANDRQQVGGYLVCEGEHQIRVLAEFDSQLSDIKRG